MENLPLTLNTRFWRSLSAGPVGKYTGKIKISESPELSGEIEVSTKWIITDEQIDELYAIYPDLWIICGITGMNEMPGVSPETRFDNYLRICKKFKKTILNVGP